MVISRYGNFAGRLYEVSPRWCGRKKRSRKRKRNKPKEGEKGEVIMKYNFHRFSLLTVMVCAIWKRAYKRVRSVEDYLWSWWTTRYFSELNCFKPRYVCYPNTYTTRAARFQWASRERIIAKMKSYARLLYDRPFPLLLTCYFSYIMRGLCIFVPRGAYVLLVGSFGFSATEKPREQIFFFFFLLYFIRAGKGSY